MVAFLPNSCFKHSLLELTVLAIVEKTKAEWNFSIVFFEHKGRVCSKRDATHGVLQTNVLERDEWGGGREWLKR